MLSKKKRVTKDIFQIILKKGNIVSGSFFLFRYIPSDKSLCAFVISKKIAKTAIKRNSFRRKGYNIIRNIKIKPCAGVFFYKKEALGVTIDDLKNDIDFIIKKAKLV